MSNFLADIGLIEEMRNVSPKGQEVKLTNDMLEAFGIEGKIADVMPVAEVSKYVIPASTTLQAMTFFDSSKNTKSSLRNVEFPNKLKAYYINNIRIDLDVNFGKDMQENLHLIYAFAKNSVVKVRLNRMENMQIPLDKCLPFVIEYDGSKYTTRVVRDGYKLTNGVKIAKNGEFEIFIEPAPGYVTDDKMVNVATEEPNVVRIELDGYSIQAVV